jgi:uncharacterized protein (TIGR00369 family)
VSNDAGTPLSVEQIQSHLERSPFIASLGIRVTRVDHSSHEVAYEMPLQPQLERRPGTRQFHGGAIAAFIDVAGDFAVGMLVGGGVPTVNFRVDYLRPAIGDRLAGCARVRRFGKNLAVVDIDIKDAGGKLLAVGRATYSTHPG